MQGGCGKPGVGCAAWRATLVWAVVLYAWRNCRFGNHRMGQCHGTCHGRGVQQRTANIFGRISVFLAEYLYIFGGEAGYGPYRRGVCIRCHGDATCGSGEATCGSEEATCGSGEATCGSGQATCGSGEAWMQASVTRTCPGLRRSIDHHGRTRTALTPCPLSWCVHRSNTSPTFAFA